jgi:hypothetical protein
MKSEELGYVYLEAVNYPDFSPESFVYVHLPSGKKVKMVAKELIAMMPRHCAMEAIKAFFETGEFLMIGPSGEQVHVTLKPRLDS